MNKIIDCEVLILGAGLTGLAAANYLTERNKKVIVVEKKDKVGGICRSVSKKDFIFDLGGHRFFTKNIEILDLVKDIMKDNLIISERQSEIYWRNKFINYPLSFKQLVGSLNWEERNKMFFSLIKKMISYYGNEPENLKEYFLCKFGDYLYDWFFKEYNEKLWGRRVDEISSDWAKERIPELNYKRIFYHMINMKNRTPLSFYKKFYYPAQGGIGKIPQKFAERIEEKTGEIFLNTEGVKIIKKSNEIELVECIKGNEKIKFSPDYLVSTIPITQFLKILKPVKKSIFLTSKKLKFRSLRFLHLILDKERVTKNTWIYVPFKDLIFFRIQEPKNWNPKNAPFSKTSLTLEIACDYNDDIWRAGDKNILDIALKDLKQMNIHLSPDEIRDFFFSYERYGYPVYDLDYRSNIKKIMTYLDNIKNLSLGGRQGKFVYANMDKAIEMGIEVGKESNNYIELLP